MALQLQEDAAVSKMARLMRSEMLHLPPSPTAHFHHVLHCPSALSCVKVAVLDPSRSFRVGECQVALDDIKPAAWLRHVETI